MDEKKLKKEIWILAILILVIAGLIIAIVATKMDNDLGGNGGSSDTGGSKDEDEKLPETPETIKKEVAKVVDLARIPSFLTIFGQEKVNLAESAEARFKFIEYVVLDGSEEVDYSFTDDGYIIRYKKLEDFKNDYKQTYGEKYDFEADLNANLDDFYDCAEKYGEDYYCFKNYFVGEDLVFEELGDSIINGEKGNYNLTGKVKVFIKLEEVEKQYEIEFENYFLKNLIIE